PPAFERAFAAEWDEAAAALLALVLSSVCRKDEVGIALVDERARAALGAAEARCYPSVPCALSVDASAGFGALVRAVAGTRGTLAGRRGFLWDLCARHPELARDGELLAGRALPIALVLGNGAVPPGTPLALCVRPSGVSLCSDGRLDATALDTFAGWMRNVAAALVDAPEARLRDVCLLGGAELRQQIYAWNDKGRVYPEHERLHDRFEARVAEQPDAVALVFDGETLTFAELERGANRVANTLLAHGVRPGERVGLYVERGFELIFALLGVAKSGAAYVPLDTAYPED
ncbi:MAG: AMP-binding protein, partial [Variovorax sp.]